jgi:threonine aldolase
VGSLLLGENAFIKKARRIRKVFGGGMRQGGYLAAAGIFALQNNIDRLAEDHQHTQQLAQALREKEFVTSILPVETNIIIFNVAEPYTGPSLVAKLKEHHILAYAIAPTQVRLVVHLDITPAMVEETIAILKRL